MRKKITKQPWKTDPKRWPKYLKKKGDVGIAGRR